MGVNVAYRDLTISGGSTGTYDGTITVTGNLFKNGAGQTVQLRGFNIAGNEYAPIQGWSPQDPSGGNQPDAHIYSDWKANCVRIPLNEAAWNQALTWDTDASMHVSDPGGNYRASIASQVAAAKAKNCYVVLDLHWGSPATLAPMQQDCMANYDNSLRFWTSVANTYKTDPAVIMELFNEPTLGQQNGTLQPARTGTATGGSSTTLIDSTKTWRTNQFAGGTLRNTTTSDQSTIVSNTATTITHTSTGGDSSGNSYAITAPFVTLMEGGYVDQAIGNSNNGTYKQINMLDLSAYTGITLWPGDTISKGGVTATVLSYDTVNQKIYHKDWSGSFSTGTGLTRTAQLLKCPPLISRSLSQTPSVSSGTATDIVSTNYNNRWRTSGTVSGQYCSFYVGDKVSAGLRNVGIFWMQDATYGFRPDLTGGGTYYNCPGSYQIRVNAAGAGARPTTGWFTVETVTGNNYTKRMHTVSMTGGWNWVELYFTASNGSSGNSDIEIKCDLYDVTNGWAGCVLGMGDSITANTMLYKDQGSATSPFHDQAHSAGGYAASTYPVFVNCGIPGWDCNNWLGLIDEVLSLFPCQIVEFSLGANDSGGGSGGLSSWSANVLALAQKARTAGRTAAWATILQATDGGHGPYTASYNSALATVISANPWIINGTNRYALGDIVSGNDGLHPDNAGVATLRSAEASWYAGLSGTITATVSDAQAKWRIAGMQEMLNAVRATGATNVCLVSGNSWNDDLSGVLANIPTDSASKLAVAWHPYPPTQRIDTATIATAGSGHAVGNIITFARPTESNLWQASARVTSVSSGAVTGIAFDNDDMRGLFLQNHLPSGNLVQSATDGSGTGLQISVTVWKNQGSQWSMPSNWPAVETIMATYALVCTESGEVSYSGRSTSPWITDITNWCDSSGAGMLFWQINDAGWNPGENVLTKDANGTPADGYGVAAYNWLVNHG